MRLLKFLLAITAVRSAAAVVGFTSYREIREGADNSGQIAYWDPDRSNTLFLYIQIIAGWDHVGIINDFKTLAQNYGSRGVGVIPRVRYGNADGSVTTEPTDSAQLLRDVSTWAGVFANASSTIRIPVIQAGFLGPWGEWHDGPFTADTAANRVVKKQIVQRLQASGRKIALRYPPDHKALFPEDRTVTLHNDCIFNGGPNGADGGTFPADDRQGWIDYAIRVAGGNTSGGEGCNDAGDSAFDWWNWDELCGSNGLATYINKMQFSYLNPGFPPGLQALFTDSGRTACVNTIQAALLSWA